VITPEYSTQEERSLMMKLSRFRPDTMRTAEFLAGLWQGDVPPDLVLHRWLYVESDLRQMVLVWEGGAEAERWIQRAFGEFGTLTSESVTDTTGGLAACLARDLDAFGEWMRARGSTEDEITVQLDVRRRGLEASSRAEALAAGRAWRAEQDG
jgi:hypothetical protein